MKVLGLTSVSLIDFPKVASTVVFTGGCNFMCGYCHNPDIALGKGDEIDHEEIFAFLKKRKRFLDGVVISGGEPTIHPDLPDFIRQVRALGYLVKLDTNGGRPEVLAKLIDEGLLDYIAMDVKGPFSRYSEIVGAAVDIAAIERSIALIMTAGVDYEFRTTVCREYLDQDDLIALLASISGAKKYCLQSFRNPGAILCPDKAFTAYSEEEMKALGAVAEGYVEKVVIR